jgi:hypothetical protein
MMAKTIWTYQVRANGRDIAQFTREGDAVMFVSNKRQDEPDVEYTIWIDGSTLTTW